MNWVNELCDLYDKNQEHAGEMTCFTRETKDGPVEIPLVLLPISHTTVPVSYTHLDVYKRQPKYAAPSARS